MATLKKAMQQQSKNQAKAQGGKKNDLSFTVSAKQGAFITTSSDPVWFADEVLFGGAAGGGKTYANVIDAFRCAEAYPGIKQLILRRSFPELKRSIIMAWLLLVPERRASYNSSDHIAIFPNGSIVEFGYLENDESVSIYKSAEYDIIRLEEATEFSPFMITYMKSRIRGANPYPKQLKMTTNPGGPAHKFLRKNFYIGVKEPLTIFKVKVGVDPETGEDLTVKRVYIPALVTENPYIMQNDPGYIKRLMQLPEKERKALLEGNWDIHDDMAFGMFDYNVHVCKAFIPPDYWKKWRSCDNGYNDPFAFYWFTVSEDGVVYVYREYTRAPDTPKIHYSDQARRVVELSKHYDVDRMDDIEEKISYTVAGLDAWNTYNSRDVEGKTIIDHYAEGGLRGFIKAITDRTARYATLLEYLRPYEGPDGCMTAKLQIMDNCPMLLETLPDTLIDPKEPEKYAESESDHWVDALGYGILAHHASKSKPRKSEENAIRKHKRQYAAQDAWM